MSKIGGLTFDEVRKNTELKPMNENGNCANILFAIKALLNCYVMKKTLSSIFVPPFYIIFRLS